jgi:hypothetical protein
MRIKYTYDDIGRMVCDACGQPGGVRKRKCRFKVLGDSLRGPRAELPWCIPPAMCKDCYAQRGGSKGVHGERCRDAAAASQAESDAIEAALDAGESLSISAWGDWESSVPRGKVGLLFTGRAGQSYRLMDQADYPNRSVAMSAVATTQWAGP